MRPFNYTMNQFGDSIMWDFINSVFDMLGFVFLAVMGAITLGGVVAYLVDLGDQHWD